jgi:hypothetical protein
MFWRSRAEHQSRVSEDGRSPEEAARNEAVFRDANEHIEKRRQELELVEAGPYLCECEEPSCTQTLLLSPAEYERVRSDSQLFLIAPDHRTTCASIVERNDGYWVVRKEGVAGEVAAELDPRS